MPVVILVRLSTVKGETDRQISELKTYARDNGYEVMEICRETASGGASENDAQRLRHVEELSRTGQIRKVLVYEIGRLARRSNVAHRFLQNLEESGVSLYWHTQGIETLLVNGQRNPAAGVVLALLAEVARNETETLREQINSGLAEARRKGVKLGRPIGTTLGRESFLQKHADVLSLLREGHSIRHAAKVSGKGMSTVQRVKGTLTRRAPDLKRRTAEGFVWDS